MIIDEKYTISGMSCAACSARVDRTVRNLEGVKELNVNLLTNSMVVSYDETVLSSEKIIEAVKKSGYGASLLKDNKEDYIAQVKNELDDKETPKLLKRLISSIILLIPLFYLCMGYMLDWPIGILKENLIALALIEMVLSLAIMLINNKFFISGSRAILHKSANMDTLVMLGSGVAFIYSFVITIILIVRISKGLDAESANMLMMNISFETAGMVPTLITIGKTLESYSKGKTTNSIKSLMDLSPKTALILENNVEKEVLINEVKVDDIFVVKPGMSIPVDGVVINGFSSIDESMLTGESMPINKEAGSLVKSATINQDGVLTCKAVRVGSDTTLSQIIQMVEKAANSKAKISQIADKISAIFVPIVIGIAIVVFTFWMIFGQNFIDAHPDIHSTLLSYSINRGISILVISCPCALGLATPVAIMVGSGKGAKNGFLYKNAVALEEVGKTDFVILDKTGTITKGEPTVTDVINYINKEKLLEIAYALENGSSHPLAKAINKYAEDIGVKLIQCDDFINHSGKGVEGRINNIVYYAGNYKFLNDNGVSYQNISIEIDRLSSEGKTPLIFADKEEIIGIIAVSDVIKEDSKDAIDKIKNLGIIPVMLTGDNSLAAHYIASQVDINYVISDVLPEGKLDVINRLKENGKVTMVGDGINDAAALTSADIGIAIGQGSDVAIESADVVLMNTSLEGVYGAIRLSQYVYLNIKENLFWAFFYNIIMIPIAAGVFSTLGLYKLAPWMGSAAMALSSLFVVLNALRINLFKPNKVKHAKKEVKIPEILTNQENICDIQEEENIMKQVLKIKGMMCEHCANHVKEALEKVDGVNSVKVNLKKDEAVVKLDKEVANDVFAQVIKEAGYELMK